MALIKPTIVSEKPSQKILKYVFTDVNDYGVLDNLMTDWNSLSMAFDTSTTDTLNRWFAIDYDASTETAYPSWISVGSALSKNTGSEMTAGSTHFQKALKIQPAAITGGAAMTVYVSLHYVYKNA